MTVVGDVSYTWDERGNLLNNGTFTFTYDAAGRLVGVKSVTNTIVYTYNGDGMRVAMAVDDAETRWVQDMGGGLSQVLAETSAGETTLYL